MFESVLNLSATIGLLYTALLASRLIVESWVRIRGWNRARRLRPKLVKSDFVVIPTAEEMLKYGAPSSPGKPKRRLPLPTYPPFHWASRRIDDVILLSVIIYLIFVGRLLYYGFTRWP